MVQDIMRPTVLALAGYAALGFGVWLNGAVLFRFGAHFIFESGWAVLALCALGVAFSVCLLLSATMGWRKAAPAEAVTVAVAMALPGLLGDVGYILAFPALTGLRPEAAGPYAALVIFGNAALLGYALVLAHKADRPPAA